MNRLGPRIRELASRPWFTMADTASLPARLLLAVVAVVVLGYVAFALAVIGLIVATGCFISCETPRPLIGLPLGASAGLLVGLAVNSVAWSLDPSVGRSLGRWRPALLGLTVVAVGMGALVLDADATTNPTLVRGFGVLAIGLGIALGWWRRRDHLTVIRGWKGSVRGRRSV